MTRAKREDTFLRKQVADLTQEVERKKRLAMQAIAARGQFKDLLEEYQQKIDSFNHIMARKEQEMAESKSERDRYEKKHDEMFQAVSSLNARIEELEQHKLHLLQKLKQHGDKGDLGYIIKTQKLEGIKGKEFEGKVVVEDYQPELNRQQMDQEYLHAQLKNDVMVEDV